MSATVEAAAKAMSENIDRRIKYHLGHNWEIRSDYYREQLTEDARTALAAALPHLTEELGEVLRTHTCEYGDCACGWHPTLGDDDLAKHQAAAITEELKRRIEE